ncbi:MAG: hypothetical protein HOV96_28945, partial [Nonomuraea sp.]|nr:hypothetical protein [Nonomuraea sp.]
MWVGVGLGVGVELGVGTAVDVEDLAGVVEDPAGVLADPVGVLVAVEPPLTPASEGEPGPKTPCPTRPLAPVPPVPVLALPLVEVLPGAVGEMVGVGGEDGVPEGEPVPVVGDAVGAQV